MLKWLACALCAFLAVACGQVPQSLQKDEIQEPAPIAYTMAIEGEQVVWAYGAEGGPLNGPVMGDGLLLENLTPGKPIDDDQAQLTLMRAVNGRVHRGNELVTFLDKHPDDDSISLSYQLRQDEPVSVRRMSDNRFKVYINLYRAPPSYRNAQGVSSPQVPIGIVTVPEGRTRAYVNRDQDVMLASISQGAGTGSWALKMFSQTNAPPPASSVQISEWCDTTTTRSGTLQNQSPGHTGLACRPRPSEFDLCQNARSGIEGCIGPAPVESASPFSEVGELDTTFLTNYNSLNRVFTVNPQSPHEVKIAMTFVAKTITAESSDNATKCKNLFRAVGWTIGARINEHCVLTPDASPRPVDGHLACGVTLRFVHDRTYQDKNCYVSGIFNGEEELMEQLLIYRE